ncbi:MAG: response regulator transcription factor [Lachnospiraceae bacterium]|nr:response regulator transcription factor [Lachnospiraceae bacterium]
MIKIAMVEDRPEERERIKECLSYMEETEKLTFSVSEFSTGNSFLGNYQHEYDIVLMDIDLPGGMNGMETARQLRRMDSAVILIFVTSMVQYAVSGYEVDAMDFIVKPINKYSFAIKLQRAVSRMTRKAEQFIPVKTDGETMFVRREAIKYLEVQGHYVIFHTTDGTYTEYTTLKEAKERIGGDLFVHTSRSFIVNLQYVTGINKDMVTVSGDELQISRPQKKAFLSALSGYMGGRR